MEKTKTPAAQFPPRPGRELPRAGSRPLFALENARVQVVNDQTGQPLVMYEQPLADRIGVLLRNWDRLLQDLLGADAAVDIALDESDPVLDDLRLFPQVSLAAGFAVAG